MYVEGCAMSPRAVAVYDKHREPGRYLPGRDTVYPKSTIRRVRFSDELVHDIERLAQEHGVPELFDHVSLYEGATPLLYWHDAFENVLRVSGAVGEDVIATFAAHLGVEYRRG